MTEKEKSHPLRADSAVTPLKHVRNRQATFPPTTNAAATEASLWSEESVMASPGWKAARQAEAADRTERALAGGRVCGGGGRGNLFAAALTLMLDESYRRLLA